MEEFLPSISQTRTDLSEKKSILFIENLLIGYDVRTYLSENDKTPDMDGCICILDNTKRICGKISVQIKTYPNKINTKKKENARYDIPNKILGYAKRMQTEVVILLVADVEKEKVYWKHIENTFIDECCKRKNQKTFRHYFLDSEIITNKNVADTIKRWQSIYDKKIDSFKDLNSNVRDKVYQASIAFETITPYFYNLNNSHIERKETSELFDWINSERKEKRSNVALLVGEAGMGKSVVIKELLTKLQKNEIATYAIKADMKGVAENPLRPTIDTLESLSETFSILLSNKDKAVLLIDQIDALSQCLSNDQYKINSYLALINEFSKEKYKDVRIVVSCRKFDLEYDPRLSSLKNNKVFELNPLSVDEVKNVLNLLPLLDNIESISKPTIEILRTPQYLDIFCRVYDKNKTLLNATSPHSLYDELWNQTILHTNNKVAIKANSLEDILYKIAEKIQQEETLSPYWIISGNDNISITYLSTEGIVKFDGKQISFFHQTFYDYVLARYYTINGFSLVNEVIKKHQGLFLRSTIKIVISYQRDHNESLYKKELETLLLSNNIRFHIKLLILQTLGSFHDLKLFEIKIIKKLITDKNDLINIFIRQTISTEWFDAISICLKDRIANLENTEEKNNFSLVMFIARYASERVDTVFQLISAIKDSNIQSFIAERALWFTTDYRSKEVQHWYTQLKNKSKRLDSHYLENAITSCPEYACQEVKVVLLDILLSKDRNDHNSNYEDNSFIEDVCEPLVKICPLIFYPILKDVFFQTIEASRYSYGDNYLDCDTVFFNQLSVNNKYNKIIDWIVILLNDKVHSKLDFVKKEIEDYCNMKENSSYIIVLQVINTHPQIFTENFFSIIQNKNLVESLLNHNHTEYHFRELLNNIYIYLTTEQREWYQNYVLQYSPKNDFLVYKYRNEYHPLLFYKLGYQKRKLIYSIPNQELTAELKKIKQELDRRYKSHECKNIKPKYGVSMASICGGLTSTENYSKFTQKVWLSSFIKCENNGLGIGKREYFDINQHAIAFKKCVSDNPNKFYPFIQNIFDRENIHNRYKIAALEGLLEGNYPLSKTLHLYYSLIKSNYEDYSQYQLIELTRFICKCDGDHIDKIIEYLCKIILKPLATSYTSDIESKHPKEIGKCELLQKAINTTQGRAIKSLIKICSIELRKDKIYTILIDLYPKLSIELHLVVLHYIYVREYYNENLFSRLLQIYLQEPISEYLIVQSEAIHAFWYNKPEVVFPYISSILHNKRSQLILSSILFFGTEYENSKCFSRKLLDEINENNTDEVVKNLIRLSIKNISENSYRNLCIEILIKYSTDPRVDIISEYTIHFSELPVSEFPLFNKLFEILYPNLNNERLSGILDYIKDCSSTYPLECYECLDKLSKIKNHGYGFEKEHILEFLLAIYKNLNQENEESLLICDKILDTIDNLMYNGEYRLDKILD